jgi:hypothetical protein
LRATGHPLTESFGLLALGTAGIAFVALFLRSGREWRINSHIGQRIRSS